MSHDTWAHRLVRPIVRRLVNTAATPNQLTAARLLTAVASSLLLAGGDPRWSDVGAAIFLVSFFLDRADGDLARLSGKASALGHRFDLCSDYSANILAFMGMGFGLQSSPLGTAAIALGALAAPVIGAAFWPADSASPAVGRPAVSTPRGFSPATTVVFIPTSSSSGRR